MTLAAAASHEPVLLRAARSLLTTFESWTDTIQPTWTVAAVRSALEQHEIGDFNQSAQLVDAMFRDDRIKAVDRIRTRALLGSKMLFTAPESEEEDPLADEMAVEFGIGWTDRFPEDDLAEIIYWRRWMGFAIVELVWTTGGERWDFTVKVWHPQHLRYDRESTQWLLQTREHGEIEITPGDGKWVLFGPGLRPWMDGLVRSLAFVWLGRQFALRDWYRFSEKHGLPTVIAEVPAIGDADDKQDFVDALRVMSTESTVMTPTHLNEDGARFDLKTLEFEAKSHEGFKMLLDQLSDIFAVTVLGNNLLAEVRGGSFAAAKAQSDIFDDLKQADGEELATGLRAQASTWWARLNFEGGEDRVPWALWQTEPPEDLKIKAEAVKIAGEAIKTIQEAGYQIADPESFGELFGIKIREADPVDPFAPPPVDDEPTSHLPDDSTGHEPDGGTDHEPSNIDDELEENADHPLTPEERRKRRKKRSVRLKDGKRQHE